jgi:hypothetical protein
MENPATWGPVERLIQETLDSWHAAHAQGIVGLSLATSIANTLRANGYCTVTEDQTPPTFPLDSVL